MAKKVQAYIKLQVAAGKANPSPPVGPALGQHGVKRAGTFSANRITVRLTDFEGARGTVGEQGIQYDK